MALRTEKRPDSNEPGLLYLYFNYICLSEILGQGSFTWEFYIALP